MVGAKAGSHVSTHLPEHDKHHQRCYDAGAHSIHLHSHHPAAAPLDKLVLSEPNPLLSFLLKWQRCWHLPKCSLPCPSCGGTSCGARGLWLPGCTKDAATRPACVTRLEAPWPSQLEGQLK